MLVLSMALLGPSVARAQEGDAVVHAVVLLPTDCADCQTFVEEVLPPVQAQFGPQLDVLTVDSTTTEGEAVIQALQDKMGSVGAVESNPVLVVGDQTMDGLGVISARFVAVVEEGLAAGGVDWPALDGLDALLAARRPTAETVATPAGEAAAEVMGPAAGGVR